MTAKTILWFRQDLRLQDNPALARAIGGGPVLPVYILDRVNAGDWAPGGAGRWWLHHSLQALNQSLGNRLWVFEGDPGAIIEGLVQEHGAQAVCWNRCYEPWRVRRDREIKRRLEDGGLRVDSCNGSLLWEPWTNMKPDGTPYRVFTAFYRNALKHLPLPPPEPVKPQALQTVPCSQPEDRIDRLGLLPRIPWYREMAELWTPGEAGAGERLERFIQAGIRDYPEGRDFPARPAVSRLSPHLHFGELSPRQALSRLMQCANAAQLETQVEHFQKELAWREFSYALLYHFPELPRQNLDRSFDEFPWRDHAGDRERWSRGETGYPLVDAGMRELWTTGYMHNRVRMIVGSFLVKNLLIPWQAGAEWFWDCLLDADLANNSCSWQWVAGCGADAAPYFRIFNPVTQSRKFDPGGDYIRAHLPVLRNCPDKYLHDPGSAPPAELAEAGIVLDRDYPAPMVDLKESRERALAACKALRGKRAG